MPKFWGEYRPYDEQEDGLPHFGQVVLDFIKRKKWTVKQFGDVYGRSVRNKAYTKMRIYQMIQENSFPQDPIRRTIIANLLNIPTFLLVAEIRDNSSEIQEGKFYNFDQINEKSIDLSEYRNFLEKCYKKDSLHTAQEMINDLNMRSQRLHIAALYTHDGKEICKLLCRYQIFLGKIEGDRQHYNVALDHLNKAIWLAKERSFLIFYIIALLQHGIILREQGSLQQGKKAKGYLISAARNFSLAIRHQNHLDDTLKAALFMADSDIQAYLHFLDGETQDIKTALHLMDQAYTLIKSESHEAHIVRFNQERWNLARASTLIDIHNPKDAIEYLDNVLAQIPSGKRRYAYLNALLAKAYFQSGMFPISVSHALEALHFARDIHSRINITRVASVYDNLLQTKFSNNPDVVELGLELLQAQHPHLFLKDRPK